MRKKMCGHLGAVLKGILFIGFSIQIVLGIIWMCFNFASIQDFRESGSVVYRALFSFTGKNAPIMYVLQLALAGYASHRLLNALRPGGKLLHLWSILVLLTFPMGMQCHMALLSWSFVGSLLFLEFAEVIALWKEKAVYGRRNYISLLLCWLLLAVLLPEYRLLGGIPVVLSLLFCLRRFWKQKKQLAATLALTVLCGAIALGLGTWAESSSGTEDRSRSFALAHRMAWPFIQADSLGWPEEVREAIGGEDAILESSFYADNMDLVMISAMENAFGSRQADSYYCMIAANSWRNHASVILTHMRWDVIGYSAAPLLLSGQLKGDYYESFSGRNYDNMRREAPLITKYYIDYSCWWFGCSILLTLILTIACFAEAGSFLWKDFSGGLLVCVLSSGVLVAWYTMQGSGIMDYKATIAVSSLWLVWALTAIREEGTSGEG